MIRPRRVGAPQSPLGHTPAGGYDVTTDSATKSAGAVGFDPLADASQGPSAQTAQVGTLLVSTVQAAPQIDIPAISLTRQFGLVPIPLYVGWCQLYPRIVLAAGSVPDDALPLRVGYFNGPTPVPANTDQAGIVSWLTNSATPFHTHYSVTLENPDDFVFGTPFSEAAPVFLPPGQNVAVFFGLTTDLAYAGDVLCYLTAIASPINEQLMLPASKP